MTAPTFGRMAGFHGDDAKSHAAAIARSFGCGPAHTRSHEGRGWAVATAGAAAVVTTDGDQMVAADLRLDDPVATRDALGLPPTASPAHIARAAHDRWQTELPRHLTGDYAIVVRDGHGLHLYRDPMGLRPLYYTASDKRLAWSSEAHALVAAGVARADIDDRSVARYLLAAVTDPGRTFWRDIEEVPPGCCVTLRPVRRTTGPHRPAPVEDVTAHDLDERFADTFLRAVDRRTAEGSTALMLSGGTDSLAIAATVGHLAQAGELDAADHPTLSFAFDEFAADDEREVSRLVTEPYGLRAEAVEGDDGWLFADPDLSTPVDEPFMFSEHGVQLAGARRAAELGVDGVITGDRGDEVVGHGVWDDHGLARSGAVGSVWRELGLQADWAGTSRGRAAWRQIKGRPDAGPNDGHRAVPAPFIPDRLLNATDACQGPAPSLPDELEGRARRERYRWVFSGPAFEVARYRTRLYADHGLGFAEPWSDRDLVALILGAPQHRIQTRADPKAIVPRALHRLLPGPARARRAKHLPDAMFAKTFRGAGVASIRNLIETSVAVDVGYVDGDRLREGYQDLLDGRDPRFDLWRPLSLEFWLRAVRR